MRVVIEKLILISLIISEIYAKSAGAAPASPRPPPYTSSPRVYEFVPNAFSDVPDLLRDLDPREHWRTYGWITALTAALVAVDQPLLDGAQRFATRVGLISAEDPGRETYIFARVPIFGLDLPLNFPRGVNASLYYLGDGLTSISIVAGLATYGGLAMDRRAQHTASQVMEALVLTGFCSVVLKTSTGRESPFRASAPGGAWHPFPGYGVYLHDIPRYDAFPSGHVATVMATTRVLSENYPEKSWIRPLGYLATGLLGFAMMANGVHWASDYPVGIAMGYVAAGVVLKRRMPDTPPPPGSLTWGGISPDPSAPVPALVSTWTF